MWEDNIFAPEPATQEIDYDHEAGLMSRNFKALVAWDKGDVKFLTNPQLQTLTNQSWFRSFCFRWMDWYERDI